MLYCAFTKKFLCPSSKHCIRDPFQLRNCFCVRNADNSSDWKLKLRLHSWSHIPYSHSESKICSMCLLLKHMTPRCPVLHLLAWFLLCKIPVYKAWMWPQILCLRAVLQPIEQKLLSDRDAEVIPPLNRREKWLLLQYLWNPLII